MTTPLHDPVMVTEVIELLAPSRGGLFVDCTVGLGGHSRALLEAGASSVLGFDRDATALQIARERLAPFGDRVRLAHADYRDLDRVLGEQGIDAVAGALADLGVSSMQFDAEGRGFSFRRDEPLDMRMDQSRGPSAADLLRDAEETEIADVIFRFGEERHSRRVARAIVWARRESAIDTTGRLAAIVRRAVPHHGYQRIDPATRTFQALRIWVNEELEGLEAFIERAVAVLEPGGRLAMIAFHSLEDRIVKHTMRRLDASGAVRLVTRRPTIPGEAEIAANPRSRSARLRAVERAA